MIGVCGRRASCAAGSAATVAALLALTSPAAAQIRGQVVDDRTGGGVAAARVSLLDADGDSITSVVAAGDGRFEILWSGERGSYVLRVDALGYAGAGDPIRYEGSPVLVELRVAPAPIELDALEVSVEPRSPYLARSGFYDRRRFSTG